VFGEVPEPVREMIEKQNDVEKLSEWHKFAAKSESIEEFVEKANKPH
jgi:hypothetical protein